ncbi:hypothetical protein DRO41_00665 [Candidatus Bathyarchaeota archaeon]|nr:MAG: hypothetical protein DRO41_00665 [Candidatus Bathyarchaeota archaeon]
MARSQLGPEGGEKKMRTVWQGIIRVRSVEVPVRLYRAFPSNHGTPLHLICPTCHRKLKYRLFCESCGREVDRSEAMKGYEVSKGQLVPVDPVDKLMVVDDKTIHVDYFAPHVPEIYHDTAYVVGPDGDAHAYVLLREVLRKRVAVGHMTFRDKTRRVCLKRVDDFIVAFTLTSEELRRIDVVGKVKRKELSVMKELAVRLTRPFQPVEDSAQWSEGGVSSIMSGKK